MRIPLVAATLALLTLGFAGTPAASDHGVHAPDGVTAFISPASGLATHVFTPDAAGNYNVFVRVFQKVDGTWTQVSLQSTLRVFTWGEVEASATPSVDPAAPSAGVSASASAKTGWIDRVSVPFTSRASGDVLVTFPKSALGSDPAGFDLFVTFSELGGSPVPTSHHNVLKNVLINQKRYDDADALDYHGALPGVGL
jgi:hypothetical protein